MANKKTKCKPLLQDEVKEQKDEKQARPKRYTWFTAVLYPREDYKNNHAKIIAYIERMKVLYDKYAYIEHTKDVWSEEDEKANSEHKAGTPKKPHTHIVFHTTEQITIKGMEKRFGGYADGCFKPSSSPRSSLLYLIHDSFECELEGKYKYPIEEVKGSSELIHAIKQNTNFVQKELAEVIHEKKFLYDSQKYIFDTYSTDTAEAMFTELYKSAYYGRMSDQELKRKKYYSDDEYQQWLSMLRAKKAKEEQNFIDTDTGEIENGNNCTN